MMDKLAKRLHELSILALCAIVIGALALVCRFVQPFYATLRTVFCNNNRYGTVINATPCILGHLRCSGSGVCPYAREHMVSTTCSFIAKIFMVQREFEQ